MEVPVDASSGERITMSKNRFDLVVYDLNGSRIVVVMVGKSFRKCRRWARKWVKIQTDPCFIVPSGSCVFSHP